MKYQKKRFKILIVSLLSMSLLSNMPMWTLALSAKKSHKQKHQHVNQDNTDVVDDQNSSHSDSNSTNSNDTDTNKNQHPSDTDQNMKSERKERQWKQYLGEQNEKKGEYFKELPQIVLETLREEKVDVTFIGRLKGLGKSPFYIKKKETSEGLDVIVTKDHSTFSIQDVENFWEVMSEFTVEKRAEAGTLFTQALVDAFNEMKEKEGKIGKQGRALLFTQPFKEREERFDLDFLRAHPSDVKEMVKLAIAWSSDPNLRILLENYAMQMWEYVQGERLEDGRQQEDTERVQQIANDKAQKWMARFVTLAAMLGINFDPGTIEGIIKDANSDILEASLITDYDLITQYDFERLEILAKEFDGMVKEYNRQITTSESEGRYSSVADAAEALYREAIVKAAEMYNKADFDDLTPEQSREKLSSVMIGNYYLTRSMFQELPNEVAIRREGKAEVIPKAKYTTNIVTLTSKELLDQQRGSQKYKKKVQPILDVLDRWRVELQELEKEKGKIHNSHILDGIYYFLEQDNLFSRMPKNGSIIIAVSTYKDKMQAITVGALLGQMYGIVYTFTAPHNLLAGEGTYQGAANHLVSSVIRHVFDNYQQVETVSSEVISPYNVKSGLKLGFRREKKSPAPRPSREKLDDLLNQVRKQYSK